MSIGSPTDRLRVGVDIGGSKIAVLVVAAANKVRARDRMPLAHTSQHVEGTAALDHEVL